MAQYKYVGISKSASIRFATHSYLLSYQFNESGKLYVGKILTYGYLYNNYRVGNKRGWSIQNTSIAVDELEKYYDLIEGTKSAKVAL